MQILPRCIYLLLFLLYSFAAYTQSTNYIDSIKKVVLTQKPDNNKLINFFNLCNAYRQFCPDSSIFYGEKAIALAENLHNDETLFAAEVNLTQSLIISGNYPLELEYCFKAAALAKKLKDTTTIFFTEKLLADCYYNLGDYKTSLFYLRKVIPVVAKSFPEAMYQMWEVLSRLYNALQQPDSALFYAKAAYAGLKVDPCLHVWDYRYKLEFSQLCPLLGNAFVKNVQYDSALYYYRLAMPVSKDFFLLTDLMDDYNGIASVYKARGETDSAVWYAQKVLSEEITKTYLVGLLNAVNLLAAVYESKHKPDSTLKYVRIAINVKDSLFNREKTNAIQNLTYKEQQKEREIADSETKLQNRYKIFSLVENSI